MKKEHIMIYCIFLSIYLSGCIFQNPEWSNDIESVETNIKVDYNDIANISFNSSKQQLENKGYYVITHLDPDFTATWLDYSINSYKDTDNDNTNNWGFLIAARTKSDNTTSGGFSVTYRLYDEKDEKYLHDEEKAVKHAENEADEVARICNLTINWDEVSWNIYYKNGSRQQYP